jgi:hypothetical protein
MRALNHVVLTTLVAGVSLAAAACGSSVADRISNAHDPSTMQSLGDPHAANATPVVAASGQWVVVVWTATGKDGTDIYAATSPDAGGRFGPPVRVNDSPGEAHVYGEDPPRVAMARLQGAESNSAPAIVVTWPSDRRKHLGLRSAQSVDGGRTFSSSVSIGDESIEGERGFQSVTTGSDGMARTAWLDQRRDPGTPHHANADNDWDPMHLMYASGLPDGRWTSETRLASNVCGCCKTAIVRGPDDAIYIAFRNIYPGSVRDISMAVSRDSHTFSPPVRVSEDHWVIDGCPDDGPTMAIDHDGIVHLVWPTLVQGTEPAIGLFHASTRDGVTFSSRQQIDTLGTPKPSHPQLIVDSCGALTLTWDEAQGATRRAVMRQLMPLPSGEVRPGDLHVISGSHPATYPVVAAVPSGVLTAWTEVAGRDSDHTTVAVRRIQLDDTCGL